MMPAVASPNSKAGVVKAAPANAWSVPRDAWRGEAVFVICGGPSVAQADLTQLRGRRVFVVNDSWRAALAAGLAPELLVFGDAGWWDATYPGDHRTNRDAVLAEFSGGLATAAPVDHPRVWRLNNSRPDRLGSKPPLTPLALSEDPTAVPLRRTTVASALNIAWLGGARAIVTLGLDGKAAPDGRTHHHPRAKPVAFHRDEGRRVICWEVQGRYDLAPLVADLKARGCTVLNASPESVHGFATVTTLAEAIAHVDAFTVLA